MKYFVNEPYTLSKLRKEKYELYRECHPNFGGTEEKYQEMITEYYDLLEVIQKDMNKRRKEKQRRKEEEIEKLHTDPPADCLTLVDIPGGVAIKYTDTTKYENIDKIKYHGGKWNDQMKRWEAKNKRDIASLREWFGIDTSLPVKKPATIELGELVKMAEDGKLFYEDTTVKIGRFDNFQDFLCYFGNRYIPMLERIQAGTYNDNDLSLLRIFIADILPAFGFSIPDNQKAVQ